MTTSKFIQRFFKDPFATIDDLDLDYFHLQFNILKNDSGLRDVLFYFFFLPPLLACILLGSDSTIDQIGWLIWNFPNFALGKLGFIQWVEIYNKYYGLGTHWSASVIYSLLFIAISKYLKEKFEIKNSRNIAISAGVVGLSIACFEFFWLTSYYYFQKQYWILSLQYPQFGIIQRNILFLLVGIIALVEIKSLTINEKKLKLNFDKHTLMLLGLTIGLIILWLFYPFPTQQLTNGNWISSPNFPQTMWTIQTNPNTAYGEMYYTQNEAVHLINNLTKISMTLTFYSLFKIKYKMNKNGSVPQT